MMLPWLLWNKWLISRIHATIWLSSSIKWNIECQKFLSWLISCLFISRSLYWYILFLLRVISLRLFIRLRYSLRRLLYLTFGHLVLTSLLLLLLYLLWLLLFLFLLCLRLLWSDLLRLGQLWRLWLYWRLLKRLG